MEIPSTNRLSIVRIFGILATLTVLTIILVAMPSVIERDLRRKR